MYVIKSQKKVTGNEVIEKVTGEKREHFKAKPTYNKYLSLYCTLI